MSVKDDLIAAKALIDTPEKWGKHDFRDDDGCLCALGAVARAVHFDPERSWGTNPRASAAHAALSRAVPSGYSGNVVLFNDVRRTTHADIMALFDRAIEAAE